MGAQLFYADGRTDSKPDMTKLMVGFRDLGNAPKNGNYVKFGNWHVFPHPFQMYCLRR
jgi:hypothetical protein